MDAARNGKQVTALVELKARFDEEANVQWAHKMEEVGVHVVYGLTRSKNALKMLPGRKERGGKTKSYAHLVPETTTQAQQKPILTIVCLHQNYHILPI
jgi:polyphosphate kinase